MRTIEIRNMISEAILDEEKTGRLASAISTCAKQRGENPDEQAVQAAVSFVREYIQHVPHYLEQGKNAGSELGLVAEVDQMLGELESYWFEVNDVIPDHLGLLGLTDDAYATFVLLQSLSDYCQATLGRSLLQQNFTQANQAIRSMIGDTLAVLVEQRVGITIANALMQRTISQVVGAGFTFGGGPDPYWGNTSIDERVNIAMGAAGVI